VIRGVRGRDRAGSRPCSSARASQAADECRGSRSASPSPPWGREIPAPGGIGAADELKLICRGGIVGGVDARRASRRSPSGSPAGLGSPSTPAITTTSSLLFHGTYAGTTPRATSYGAVHRCIPTRAAASAPAPPSMRTSAVSRASRSRCASRCSRCCPAGPRARDAALQGRERLLSSSHSVGLYMLTYRRGRSSPPST